VFADHLPELRAQLLGFPTGHIDAPNALAYMLTMKLGIPIYDNFTDQHIISVLDSGHVKHSSPVYLLVNSNNQVTTAVAVQRQAGRLSVLWDAVAEGDPGTVLTDLIQDAQVALPSLGVSSLDSRAGAGVRDERALRLRLLSSPRHFDEYTIYGLRAAVRKAGRQLERGGSAEAGREELRGLFRRTVHGSPSVAVGPDATWTLRAFAGGYARDATSALPIDNSYAVLMEPLESFCALSRLSTEALADEADYSYTGDGRRYRSALVPPLRS
jgi:hypothetical protein